MKKYMFTAIHNSLFLKRQSHIQDVLNTTTDNNVKLTCDQTLQQGSSFPSRVLIPQATSTNRRPTSLRCFNVVRRPPLTPGLLEHAILSRRTVVDVKWLCTGSCSDRCKSLSPLSGAYRCRLRIRPPGAYLPIL